MATVLVFGTAAAASEVLPALGLLLHDVRVVPPGDPAFLDAPAAAVLLVDARHDLVQARALCRLLHTSGMGGGLVAVLREGGLAAVTGEWGLDDVMLETAGPAEVEARIRLLAARRPPAANEHPGIIRWGELIVDEDSYTVKLRGAPLDLTFKEFELLKFLAAHPGRVFTRAQLLQEVWGYDYFGGTRTVDVHVRRLRAKLGVEYEMLIGTVRNVGYRFIAAGEGEDAAPAAPKPSNAPRSPQWARS